MLKKIFTPTVNGFIAPNVVAMLIVAGTVLLPNYEQGVLAFSEFVVVPFLIGIMSAWFWRDINLNNGQLIAYSIFNTIIAIALSAIFLREGVICLIIVSPLLIGFIVGGTFAGRAMFKKNNRTLNMSVIIMLMAIFVFDSISKHHYENKVADTMLINAPPAEVWKHVVAFKRIKEQNKFWLFKIGLPSPVESTVDGYYLGSKRKCIFSNGYVFDEKIVTYDENRNLTFDITDQPRDPEIMGHLDLLRGQFLLKDNGDGTTTLTGNSWYRLYVFPVWYYDMWAESITRNVHIRVMEHIKELSEAR
jgi:uncharacterized protein YndB with AHSA1/START domain